MIRLLLITGFLLCYSMADAQENLQVSYEKSDDINADNLYKEILEKHKGKLIFIDFWATWCGPCIRVINELKPLKEELDSLDIAFVYITSPASPIGDWESMKKGIKGDHYRVNASEWNQFRERFGIITIPYQVLVGRKGEIIKTNVRFSERKWYRQFFEENLRE